MTHYDSMYPSSIYLKKIWTHARKSEAAEPAPTDVEEDGTVRGAWGGQPGNLFGVWHDTTWWNTAKQAKHI